MLSRQCPVVPPADHFGSASGLGQACAEDITKHGGYVAILDRNEEDGNAVARSLSPAAKFFVVDVIDSASIAAAVEGTVKWTQQTGKPLGGVIPAAGISIPGLVRHHLSPTAREVERSCHGS